MEKQKNMIKKNYYLDLMTRPHHIIYTRDQLKNYNKIEILID
jgi:hypothetical protein